MLGKANKIHQKINCTNSFTPKVIDVKPQVTQSLLTFESMGRPLKYDHSLESHIIEQYFTVVLFVFRISPVCNFGKLDNFAFGNVKGLNRKSFG